MVLFNKSMIWSQTT